MKETIIEIDIEELYKPAEEYMNVMCGFERNTSISNKSKELAMKVLGKSFDGMKMPIMVVTLEKEWIKEDHFDIEGTKIKCTALEKLNKANIKGGYAFIFRSPMPDIQSYPISEMYLADSWETCFVDAGRDKLRELLLQKSKSEFNDELYITDTLAPGMAGMPSNAVKKFFEFLKADKIQLELLPSNMMNPVKSFVGIYLVLDKKQMVSTMNCSECVTNHKYCEYCKNFATLYMGKNAEREIQRNDKSVMKILMS